MLKCSCNSDNINIRWRMTSRRGSCTYWLGAAWFPKPYGRNENLRPCWRMGPHIPPSSRTISVHRMCWFVVRWQPGQRTSCPLVAAKAFITRSAPRWECDASSRLPSMQCFLEPRGLVAEVQGALQWEGPIGRREKTLDLLLAAWRIYCRICRCLPILGKD